MKSSAGLLRTLRSCYGHPIVEAQDDPETTMVQTTNRFFDEMARLMNDAAGVAGGVRKEVETIFQAQAEKILRNLDVVTREEFEAAKEMAAKAREENDRLAARLAEIEKQLAAFQTPNG
jgi:BMFP domain-containing protein YqiC